MKKVIPLICITIGITIILEVFVSFFITKELKVSDFRLSLPKVTDNRIVTMDLCYDYDRRIYKDGLLDVDTIKNTTNAGFYIEDSKILSVGGQYRIIKGNAFFNDDTINIPESSFNSWNEYIAAEAPKKISPVSCLIDLPVNSQILHKQMPLKVNLDIEFPTDFQGNKYKLNTERLVKTFNVFIISSDELKLRLLYRRVNYIRMMMVVLLIGISIFVVGVYLINKAKKVSDS